MANIIVIYNMVYNMDNIIVYILYNLVYNMAAKGVNVERKNSVQAAHRTTHLFILVTILILVLLSLYFNTGK